MVDDKEYENLSEEERIARDRAQKELEEKEQAGKK